ncbi:hypothetical protein TNCV_2201371 [Trichonephila clavipes]|uniref:Uncharacterized protein n=1 Tax=Trichonephila clavipes TaxID=2585209 RepID=A0A8X6VFS3_TRICX|nr:hypothetical protein TNCV_2201371 [Trichonephila clavipes]
MRKTDEDTCSGRSRVICNQTSGRMFVSTAIAFLQHQAKPVAKESCRLRPVSREKGIIEIWWSDEQVGPDEGVKNYGTLGKTARVCFGVLFANRTRVTERDLWPANKKETRFVLWTHPWCLERFFFSGRERKRERSPALEGAKENDLVREWSEKEGKTMNAGGVEE